MNIFRQVLQKFQALTLRERVMAVVAAVAVLFFLTDLAVLGPHRGRHKVLQQKIDQQKMELDGLTKLIAAAAPDKIQGPLAKDIAERNDLRARVAQAEVLMGQSARGAPLSELIRAMIGARTDLALVSLRTMPADLFLKPAVPIGTPAKAASAAQPGASVPQLTIYRHGVEVAVKGRYPALLSYLQSLQSSPSKMFWASVKLDVVTYPEATLKMTIYTLSDRAESPLG